MENRVGIIPAAGAGSRWGGYQKEMLPCGDGMTFIKRVLAAMRRGGATTTCVVTTQKKIGMHAEHLYGEDLVYKIQHSPTDIYGAMEAGMSIPGDRYLFAMPDTYFPRDVFESSTLSDFTIWAHRTDDPSRYGIIIDGQVINKPKNLPKGEDYFAWGILSWSAKVSKLWRENGVSDYTEAINLALRRVDSEILEMDY